MEGGGRRRFLSAPAPVSIRRLDLPLRDTLRLGDSFPAVVGRKAGKALAGPEATGRDRHAVLRDPVGASFAPWQKGA